MFGLHIPEHEIEKVIERVLTDKRVEKIARRVTEMLLTQLLVGLQEEDREAKD